MMFIRWCYDEPSSGRTQQDQNRTGGRGHPSPMRNGGAQKQTRGKCGDAWGTTERNAYRISFSKVL